MEKRTRNPLDRVNWKRVRLELLRKSVRIPAPVFFLIFFAISWTCFTLYFRIEGNSRAIEMLQRRADELESQLQYEPDPDGLPPEDEGEVDLAPQILEM